ncbi:YgaP family membrane protein [Leptospira koniambonensis]|uniref:YgaP family membrane protein n=1 Tax=Leptospira koniambonensis TaxID=2484950 RepID=UPI003EC14B25
MKFINSNFWDRAFRVVLGTSLITWAFYIEDLYKIGIFGVGFVILATGIVGWCPIYTLFGLNTRTHSKKS